jgi:hypothetical protein
MVIGDFVAGHDQRAIAINASPGSAAGDASPEDGG